MNIHKILRRGEWSVGDRSVENYFVVGANNYVAKGHGEGEGAGGGYKIQWLNGYKHYTFFMCRILISIGVGGGFIIILKL